jgi:ClpP class serine protease
VSLAARFARDFLLGSYLARCRIEGRGVEWIVEALSGAELLGQLQVAAVAAMLLALAAIGWRWRGRTARMDSGDVPTSQALQRVLLATDQPPSPSTPVVREAATTGWGDAIRRLEAKRKSHVVGFVHYRGARHQGIGEEHLQDFLWSLRDVPANAPLDIVLHSLGGYPSSIQQIARAIKAHKGPTTVFVPYYAFGLSALIALAADRVVMGQQAGFSFPQPTDDALDALVRSKGARHVEDETLVRLHYSRNMWREMRAFVQEVTSPAAAPFARHLFDAWRMDTTPIGPAVAKRLGLAVSTDMPDEVGEIIEAGQCYPSDEVEVKLGNQVRTGGGDAATSLSRQRTSVSDGYGWCEPSCHLGVAPFLRRMQERRGSSVICVVHSASMGSELVDMTTAKDVLRALSTVDPDSPLDIVLHTPGGVSFHGWQIARALKAHRGRKTVFVPYFAWSAGTIIALAADEIVMSDHAALGPIDTQYNNVPVSAWISVLKQKPRKKIDDLTLFLAERSARLMRDDHAKARELMKGVYAPRVAERIVRTLNDGTLTHGYPVTFQAARKLGLKVTNAMPDEPVQIVHEFRDPDMGYRSVIFCSG